MPAETRLNLLELTPGSVGATTTVTLDVLCTEREELVVTLDANGAASGDWTVVVVPFESDGTTVMPAATAVVPAVQSSGPTFSGGKVGFYGRYDISGLGKVQVQVRNTTAGALNLNRCSAKLGSLSG